MAIDFTAGNKQIDVGGLAIRYFEEGSGHPVILLHGGSLGSSADVFRRNMAPLAASGFRPIAFDSPGFGLSGVPADHSNAYRARAITGFMDALGLSRAAIVAHSQAGGPAAQLALKSPERVSHLVVLGTGSLLPPADDSMKEPGVARTQPAEVKASDMREPSLDETRQQLEWNLFHPEFATAEELAHRHSMSVGRNFAAHLARTEYAEQQPPKPPATPLWQRLIEVKPPLRLMFGRQDRSWAYKRAMKLKDIYPALDLLILEDCKHMVPWDAAGVWEMLAVEAMRR